ncbi:MAG: hypothetical protein ACO25M_09340 [Limnohabitans sp.]
MKTKQVDVDGVSYTVREAKMGDMLEHLKLMAEDTQRFQVELMKASVLGEDGQPLGGRISDLSLQAYIKLSPAVMQVNGFASDDEGNG